MYCVDNIFHTLIYTNTYVLKQGTGYCFMTHPSINICAVSDRCCYMLSVKTVIYIYTPYLYPMIFVSVLDLCVLMCYSLILIPAYLILNPLYVSL